MSRVGCRRIATGVRHLAAGLVGSRLLMAYVALGILSGFGNGGPVGLIDAVINYALLGVYALIVFLWTDNDDRSVEPKQEMAVAASRRRDVTAIVVVFALAFGFAAWLWSHVFTFEVYSSIRRWLGVAGWNPALAAMAATASVASVEAVMLF